MGFILKKYINRFGYEIEHGYFTVSEVSYNVDKEEFRFVGKIYLGKDYKEEGFEAIDTFEDTIKLVTAPENLLEFPYEYIKSIVDNKTVEEVKESNPRYKGFIGYEEEKS